MKGKGSASSRDFYGLTIDISGGRGALAGGESKFVHPERRTLKKNVLVQKR